MSDYWARYPNLAGREYGPIYRRTIGDLHFSLIPSWRPRNRYGKQGGSGPKDRSGMTMVKEGYEIEGMPEIKDHDGQEFRRLAETLAEAKRRCELFAQEVAEGKVDPKTGDR